VLQRPLARLLLGAAFLAVLILIITLVVKDCRRSQLVDSYKSYMTQATQIANDSAEDGKQLLSVLRNDRQEEARRLAARVRALSVQGQELVRRAQDLDPPGKVDASNQALVTTMQYRVTGLRLLADALPTAIASNDSANASATIADRMQRLLASDVIYKDSFVGPAKKAERDDDISGVPVPESSQFLPGTAANYASPGGARALLPRLKQARGKPGGGVHGLSLVKTVAIPSNKELSQDQNTQIPTSVNLKWRVTVENQGDFVENAITVKATFSTATATPSEAQTVQQVIRSVDAGKQASVDLIGPTSPMVDEQASLRVEVQPVQQEQSTANNTAEYPVTLTLGP
jgi:hypothetical protein